MNATTITSKHQVTIPIDLVRKFNIQKGQKLFFDSDENTIIIRPKFVSSRGRLAKYAKNAEGKDFNQIRKEAWERAMKEKYERYAKQEKND